MHKSAVRFALPLMALFYFGPTLASQGQGGAAVEPIRMVNASKDPLLAGLRFRSIGPASMGGRIDDLAISETDPSIMYVGYATGGVFKSDNAGRRSRRSSRHMAPPRSATSRCIPTNPDVLYVGTGEANNRQTSSFGDGIYKTTDGGKTFTHIGLRETQTIARIVIDPKNPETVYVAALGAPVRAEQGARHLQDHRRWKDLEQRQVHRRAHRVHRPGDRSREQQHPVCRQLSAPAERLLLQRRRSRQRDLEDHRRGQVLDEAHGQRPASRNLRPHRARRVALESERRLHADRGRRRESADAAARRRTRWWRRRWWWRWPVRLVQQRGS